MQAAFERVAKGRTTVAVAHRLATIQGADIIYVLGEGKVLYNVGYLFGVTDASHDGAVKFELEYELHF